MNEGLRNITEPAIPVNIGWQQMNNLLNEYLPVKKEWRFKKFLTRCAYIALILPVFLFTTLQLDNPTFQIYSGNNSSRLRALSKTTIAPSLIVNSNRNSFLTIKKLPGGFASFKNTVADLSFYSENILKIDTYRTGETVHQINNTGSRNTANILKNVVEKQAGSKVHAPFTVIPENVLSPSDRGRNKATGNTTWNLFGGMGINAAFNNSQNLQPYPIAEVRYNINSYLYVAAGLSALSPVSTSVAGISKAFYASDTINNVSLNTETTTYSHLNYADIPLSLGIKINKHISVQSGFQMSLLLNKRAEKIVSVPNSSMTVPLSALPPAMQPLYDVQVHKIDYRLTTGIRYTLKRTLIGVTYQHGLQSVDGGTYTNKNSNRIVALNVLFQLK